MRLLIGSLFVICVSLQLTVEAKRRFLVIGDWGADPASPYVPSQQTAAVTAAWVSAEKANPLDFVLNVGDNFYPIGLAAKADPRFKTSFSQIYTQPALRNATWYTVLGNHDYMGDVDSQINRTRDDPRWYLPARSYAALQNVPVKDGSDVTMSWFFLDTNPFIMDYYQNPPTPQMAKELATQDYKVQLAWLESQLKACKSLWKFVVGHHGPYTKNKKDSMVDLQNNLVPLLEKYNVSAYFNGHHHALEHAVKNNVNYFISGAGSQLLPNEMEATPSVDLANNATQAEIAAKTGDPIQFSKKVLGFLYADVTASQLEVQYYDYKGKKIYEVDLDAPKQG